MNVQWSFGQQRFGKVLVPLQSSTARKDALLIRPLLRRRARAPGGPVTALQGTATFRINEDQERQLQHYDEAFSSGLIALMSDGRRVRTATQSRKNISKVRADQSSWKVDDRWTPRRENIIGKHEHTLHAIKYGRTESPKTPNTRLLLLGSRRCTMKDTPFFFPGGGRCTYFNLV
ncbi:hypothetical protein E2C01_051580 [Portunus trituberculatus]|uniref:Uncharacterized protein n=1 Tax=Portunus trituberculatus TaxID=210409 RepID=A0A5B7GJQ1_PORTR|nr:hypothetical protein [Portunus trituberculatus]